MLFRGRVLSLLLAVCLASTHASAADHKCAPRFGKLVKRILLVAGGGILGGIGGGVVYIEANKEDDRESCGTNGSSGSPSIVVYGDSLSSGFPGYGSLPRMLVDAKTVHHGWPIGGPDSLCGRLRAANPDNAMAVWNLASPGGQIDPTASAAGPAKSLVVGTRDLSVQVSQALEAKELAPLHLIFVGHNNMDWVSDAKVGKVDPETHRQQLPTQIAAGMEAQVRRLINRAKQDGTPLNMVLYGLANFEDSYWGTSLGLEANRLDPTKYPYAYRVRENGPSYSPEYAARTVELEKRTNEALRQMVDKLQSEAGGGKIRIEYSDVIATQNFRDLKYFSKRDAFHFSKEGRALTSQLVFEDLERRGLTQVERR